MRRQIKKRLLETAKTLNTAEKLLGKLIDRKNKNDEVKKLLEDMQNCAIELGNVIESVEGDGTESVVFLEEYCELLWKCFVSEDNWEQKNIFRQIRDKGECILESLKNEFSEEKEILFVPTYASGWPKMKKIWAEFNEQDDCICYLIPVPFYEKTSDGNIIQCYEGNDFPDDLPVSWYEDYDWEVGNADVILFQNPSDNQMRELWMDERFEKERLQEYAEVLVEISDTEEQE